MSEIRALRYDRDAQLFGQGHVVQGVESWQTIKNWQDVSEAKLICSPSAHNYNEIKAGGGLLDYDNIAWYVVCIDIRGGKMTVRAVDLLELLNQRVVLGTKNITDSRRGLTDLLAEAAIPYGALLLPEEIDMPPVEVQVNWENLGDVFIKIAQQGDFGFEAVPHSTIGYNPRLGLQATVCFGIDRTAQGGATNMFSDIMGNIESEQITDNITKYKTCAIVAGEGEGAARVWTSVDNGSFDGQRREMFVDAQCITKRYTIVNPNGTSSTGTYTDAQYLDALRNHGAEKLLKNKRDNDASVKAKNTPTMRYGVHYKLGDIVPVYLSTYDLYLAARVSSVYTTVEQGIRTLTPSLSDFEILGGGA